MYIYNYIESISLINVLLLTVIVKKYRIGIRVTLNMQDGNFVKPV